MDSLLTPDCAFDIAVSGVTEVQVEAVGAGELSTVMDDILLTELEVVVSGLAVDGASAGLLVLLEVLGDVIVQGDTAVLFSCEIISL
jgi:hypothetical protein